MARIIRYVTGIVGAIVAICVLLALSADALRPNQMEKTALSQAAAAGMDAPKVFLTWHHPERYRFGCDPADTTGYQIVDGQVSGTSDTCFVCCASDTSCRVVQYTKK